MKKVLFALISLFMFAACTTTHLPAPRTYVSMIDYSAFTKQGIYVTESNSVSFDYEAIGSIVIEETGGWIPKKKSEYSDPKEKYYLGTAKKNQIYVRPDIQETFNKLIDKLSSCGANGVINMKIQLGINNIIISGMAIKR